MIEIVLLIDIAVASEAENALIFRQSVTYGK